MCKKDRFRINKIHISIVNPKTAYEKIVELAVSGEGGYICVSNLRMVLYARKHPEYAELMEHSLMNFPDGKPLTWCGRLWGIKEVSRTSGPEFFANILKSNNPLLKHYLLGDTEDIVQRILKKNDKENSSMIVGAEALPFTDVENFDYKGISERIKSSGANVVWTAMRAPKQDQFNARLFKLLPNVVCLGVGRAFRLYVNEIKDAPEWAKKCAITGLFTARQGLYKALKWYFRSFFSLLHFILEIISFRIRGQKYYK